MQSTPCDAVGQATLRVSWRGSTETAPGMRPSILWGCWACRLRSPPLDLSRRARTPRPPSPRGAQWQMAHEKEDAEAGVAAGAPVGDAEAGVPVVSRARYVQHVHVHAHVDGHVHVHVHVHVHARVDRVRFSAIFTFTERFHARSSSTAPSQQIILLERPPLLTARSERNNDG